ncbi:MAG: hypothetical protein ABL926_12190 [Novosphingobium sp.]|uniref:hypothetical protein n=1 Tax=Novosphingobium sp. TaxID=1874826 RepID=UPI0032B7B3B1
MTAPQITILDLSLDGDGHRGPYLAMLCRLFPAQVLRYGPTALFSRRSVLVPMIEESLARYALACLVGALIGRRTVGFLFRPRPALEGRGLRMRTKRSVLAALRRLPGVSTLTILPFALEPGFARIANDWIYDLQLWDLVQADQPEPAGAGGALADSLRARAGGRALCVAVGRQDRGKGFDQFVQAWTGSAELRQTTLFAYGGMVDPALAAAAKAFSAAGGFGLDRLISDAELLDFYAAADLVWCVYAPDYDQASGILGRAMQLGIPVAVRSGSLIERLCRAEGHPCVALGDPVQTAVLAALPPPLDPGAARARALRHGAESLRRLAAALGVEQPGPAADA